MTDFPHIKLDQASWQLIMNALGELPAKVSMGVISDIQQQFAKAQAATKKDLPGLPEGEALPGSKPHGKKANGHAAETA